MIPFGIKILNPGAHTLAEPLAQDRAGKWNAADAAFLGGHWA